MNTYNNYRNYSNVIPGNPKNKRVTHVMRALLEGDMSSLGVGAQAPNIPADNEQSPTQEPAQTNDQVIANTPAAVQPLQTGEDLALDQQIKGPEDPVKRFIDKLVDTKNKLFDANSKYEIQRSLKNT